MPADRGAGRARDLGAQAREELAAAPASGVKLALNGRSALAKNAGASPDGVGSPGLAIASGAGAFTDLDGFTWTPVAVPQPA